MVESVEKHQLNKQNMKETVSQKTKIDTFWVGPGMREVSFPSEPCIGTHSLRAKQFSDGTYRAHEKSTNTSKMNQKAQHASTKWLSNKMKIFLVTPFLLGKH